MLAGVEEVILVHTPVRLLLAVHVAVHTGAADGALDETGQNMLVFQAVCLLPFVTVDLAFLLGQLPVLFGNDGLMYPVVNIESVLLNDMVGVALALDLFCLSASIGQLAAVYRVIQHALDEGRGEGVQGIVLAFLFLITVIIEPSGDSADAHGGMDVLVIDHPDDLGLILGDFELAIHKSIAIGGEAAVPLALAGLLPTALHGLHQDVFALDLSDGGKDGNHKLSAVLGAVDTVFNAN